MEVFTASIACLHAGPSAAFACGLAADAFQPARAASNPCFMAASACGFLAATLVRHASYFLMYSSHSGTPIESPADAVVFEAVVFEVVVLEVFAVDVVLAAVV